jgi:hypothetical protein
MPKREITLSVVSHGQNALVNQLLQDVERVCADRVAVVLTENLPDREEFAIAHLSCPVEVIVNSERKGFGANHNAAFAHCSTPYFCVCNPDVRLPSDPFPALVGALADPRIAVAGPLVRSPEGRIEDSARRFPSAWSLLKKVFVDRREPDYPTDCGPLEVDWVAGMFMLFRSEAYRSVGGFDETYFLYYEDADIGSRLWDRGYRVVYETRTAIVHDARRASRRSFAHMRHHVAGVLRFLLR